MYFYDGVIPAFFPTRIGLIWEELDNTQKIWIIALDTWIESKDITTPPPTPIIDDQIQCRPVIIKIVERWVDMGGGWEAKECRWEWRILFECSNDTFPNKAKITELRNLFGIWCLVNHDGLFTLYNDVKFVEKLGIFLPVGQ